MSDVIVVKDHVTEVITIGDSDVIVIKEQAVDVINAGVQGPEGIQGIQGEQGIPGAPGADGNAADIAMEIHNAVEEVLSDEDEFGFWENVSTLLKKISWLNIKATLKTYFDTLYNFYTHPATHSADIITDGTTNKTYTAVEQTKLAGIEAGAEVNVNADWDAVSGDALILNKPTIPSIAGLIPYTGGTTNVDIGVHNLTVDTTTLFVDSVNHRVGIGTTSPASKLVIDLDGTGKTLSFSEWAGAGTYSTYGWGMSVSVDKLKLPSKVYFGDSSFYFYKNGLNGSLSAYNDLTLNSSNAANGGIKTYLFGQQSTGNVGIGTTNPVRNLEISATQPILRLTSTSGPLLENSVTTTYGRIGTVSNHPLYIQTNSTNQMTIDTSGKVGIGTTSPTAMLHLKAGTATANTAPLKFTSGALLTTPELGTIEYYDDGTNSHFYATIKVAGVTTRVQIV